MDSASYHQQLNRGFYPRGVTVANASKGINAHVLRATGCTSHGDARRGASRVPGSQWTQHRAGAPLQSAKRKQLTSGPNFFCTHPPLSPSASPAPRRGSESELSFTGLDYSGNRTATHQPLTCFSQLNPSTRGFGRGSSTNQDSTNGAVISERRRP